MFDFSDADKAAIDKLRLDLKAKREAGRIPKIVTSLDIYDAAKRVANCNMTNLDVAKVYAAFAQDQLSLMALKTGAACVLLELGLSNGHDMEAMFEPITSMEGT